MAEVFEKLIKVSNKEFDVNPLYCVSLPGCTWQCGFKYTDNKLQTLQNDEIFLALETDIRGSMSSVMGDRFSISGESKNILYLDANNFYGYARSETLHYDEI